MTPITLSEEQEKGLKLIHLWLDTDVQEFKLGGYAGTGKTTLIKVLLDQIRLKYCVAVASFTGKAVSILRRKGITTAQTLHSLMYTPREKNGQITFVLREYIEADIVVIDEASMVSEELYHDLLTFGVRILWIGDPAQLEPIGSDAGLMKKPDFTLTQIHRQAENSEILTLATRLRQGQWNADLRKDFPKMIERYKFPLDIGNPDQVICGFNKTRVAFNNHVRKHLKRKGLIETGERIICLRNNPQIGLFNGLQLTVTAFTQIHEKVIRFYALNELDQQLGPFDLYIPQLNFPSTVEPSELKKWSILLNRPTLSLFDYSYAITTHKAQGSEWDSVVVIEEIWEEKWKPERWRYTAVTRAAKELKYFYK